MALFLLNALDIVSQAGDSEHSIIGVFLTNLTKNGTPYRHFDRCMGGNPGAVLEHVDYLLLRELAIIRLAQNGEIDCCDSVRGHDGTMAFAVRSVARGAVMGKHSLAIGGRDFDRGLVGGSCSLRSGPND